MGCLWGSEQPGWQFEASLWMEPQKPSGDPVIKQGRMGWVLNPCKAVEEAGGWYTAHHELLEKPGWDYDNWSDFG